MGKSPMKNKWLEYERLKKELPKNLSDKKYNTEIQKILKKLHL